MIVLFKNSKWKEGHTFSKMSLLSLFSRPEEKPGSAYFGFDTETKCARIHREARSCCRHALSRWRRASLADGNGASAQFPGAAALDRGSLIQQVAARSFHPRPEHHNLPDGKACINNASHPGAVEKDSGLEFSAQEDDDPRRTFLGHGHAMEFHS